MHGVKRECWDSSVCSINCFQKWISKKTWKIRIWILKKVYLATWPKTRDQNPKQFLRWETTFLNEPKKLQTVIWLYANILWNHIDKKYKKFLKVTLSQNNVTRPSWTLLCVLKRFSNEKWIVTIILNLLRNSCSSRRVNVEAVFYGFIIFL